MSVWTLLVTTQDVISMVISRDGKILLANASISDLEKWPRRSGIERHRRQLQTAITDKLLWRKTVLLCLCSFPRTGCSIKEYFDNKSLYNVWLNFTPSGPHASEIPNIPFLCEFTIIKNNELVSACVSVKELQKVKRWSHVQCFRQFCKRTKGLGKYKSYSYDILINAKWSRFYFIGLNESKQRNLLRYSISKTKESLGIFCENLFSDVFSRLLQSVYSSTKREADLIVKILAKVWFFP